MPAPLSSDRTALIGVIVSIFIFIGERSISYEQTFPVRRLPGEMLQTDTAVAENVTNRYGCREQSPCTCEVHIISVGFRERFLRKRGFCIIGIGLLGTTGPFSMHSCISFYLIHIYPK